MYATDYSCFLACNHTYPDPNPDPAHPHSFRSAADITIHPGATCANVTQVQKHKIHGLCPPCAYEAVKRNKYAQERKECEAFGRIERQERKAREDKRALEKGRERKESASQGSNVHEEGRMEEGLTAGGRDGSGSGDRAAEEDGVDADVDIAEYLRLVGEKEMRKERERGSRKGDGNGNGNGERDAGMEKLLQVAIAKAFSKVERGRL